MTRTAVLAAALVSLTVGVLATTAPPASAESEVTVAWPEITAFNADETEYAIDVQWDGTGTLWLQAAGVHGYDFDEIRSAGRTVVDFPVNDPGGYRKFILLQCPDVGYTQGCVKVDESPLLEITRSASVPAEPSEVSVTWPAGPGFNPDNADYVPEIAWDERGSLFLLQLYGDGSVSRYDEIHEAGAYVVDVPVLGAGDTWDLWLLSCPGEVLEPDHCRYVSRALDVGVWRALEFDFGVTARIAWGPEKTFPLQIAPKTDEPIDAAWQVLDQGTVVAQGTGTFGATEPFPALGELPHLIEGHEYELSVAASIDSATYGLLTASDIVRIRWDSQNLSELTISPCCDDRDTGAAIGFYPVRDGFYDKLHFEVPVTVDDGPFEVTVTDSAGTTVFEEFGRAVDGKRVITWDGRDSIGDVVPAGVYDVNAVMTDPAGNSIVADRDISVSTKRISRSVWRTTVTPADALVRRVDASCGQLRRPARASWPGSLGLDSREVCPNGNWSRIATTNRLLAPASITGIYGRSRVTIVGAAARTAPRAHLQLAYHHNQQYGMWYRYNAGPEYGRHVGPWSDIWPQLAGNGRSYLHWNVRAQNGSDYDVRKFLVEIEYDVLK